MTTRSGDTPTPHEPSGPPAGGEARTVVILLPEIWKPLKPNHRRMFEALSPALRGYVVTMSGTSHSGAVISDFELHAGTMRPGSRLASLVRMGLFLGLPLRFRRRGKIDAVITYDPYATGLPGAILKLLLRARLVVQIMGDYHRLDPNDELVGEHGALRKTGGGLKKWLMRRVMGLTVRAADAVKVLNRDQEAFVRETWPGKRVYRFHDFTATGFFRELPTEQGDYLLAVGYPFHRKGVDVLIEAFNRIAERHPDIRLRILGHAEPSELASYQRLVGPHGRIEFVKPGWIEDVGEEMRRCYAFVHAARSEAMGRVLLEAMACGKPIVATRTNGALDYTREGETSLLCDIDDVDGLAEAMDAVLRDPARARAMGQAGFEHMDRELSEARFAERFSAMVRDVTG